jgi:hypothetical protein
VISLAAGALALQGLNYWYSDSLGTFSGTEYVILASLGLMAAITGSNPISAIISVFEYAFGPREGIDSSSVVWFMAVIVLFLVYAI